jgi:hypothetical protein
MDRWDGVGAAAVVLVAGGVWGLAGRSWAAIVVGAVLAAIYVLHEVKSVRARAAREEGNR